MESPLQGFMTNVNFPFLSSNFPYAPAYGVNVSNILLWVSGFYRQRKTAHYTTRLLTQGYQRTKLVSTLQKRSYMCVGEVGDMMTLSIPIIWLFPDGLISDVFAAANAKTDFINPRHQFPYFPKFLFRLIGKVGEACLPSNAYFPLAWQSGPAFE